MFKPRPMQQQVLAYQRGRMGVSAVPGSGKTQTLSALAAQIIAEGNLEEDQEVLVVTLVNSAVNNFSARVAQFVQERGLLPNMGYRVRTLHGLAHDIVRERPALVGLEARFQIIDERAANEVLAGAADAWLHTHPEVFDWWVNPDMDQRKRDWLRRDKWPYVVRDLARSFIKQAKDMQATPGLLWDCLRQTKNELPLVEMGLQIYTDYQRALAYRGAVDFDDLIRLALQALTLDDEFLERLRHRWPYILEDEAQDSSELQERILRMLVGDQGNWVRVGDPNQAIFETFTTADPKFLRNYLREPGVTARELPNSGRCARPIIDLANYLIEWTQNEHPVEDLMDTLDVPFILPTPPGDPQPNPPDEQCHIEIIWRKLTPEQELTQIADSIARWLPAHPNSTAAVLTPRNDRGEELVDLLKKRNLPCIELLRSTRSTRETAGVLGNVLRYLADPAHPGKLSTLYKVYRRDDREDEARRPRYERTSKALQKCVEVETYLYPDGTGDWLIDQRYGVDDPEVYEELADFRPMVQRWLQAAVMPIDQLVLTLAQDLYTDIVDLALANKLALMLGQASREHPEWGLVELSEELAMIARNERKFLGFSDEETGFDPDLHKGKVVVATIHKAKGLEWDRVYLASVNNYDFPSAQNYDQFISEKWFLRDRLNLEAETLSQLKALVHRDIPGLYMEEGAATREARIDYAAERLRLLYVGITRARKELCITWNSGRDGNMQPATPLIALQTYWEGMNDELRS